jgi:hypothetical protein
MTRLAFKMCKELSFFVISTLILQYGYSTHTAQSVLLLQYAMQNHGQNNHPTAHGVRIGMQSSPTLLPAHRGSLTEAARSESSTRPQLLKPSSYAMTTEQDISDVVVISNNPVGRLETSQNFFPERYTIKPKMPNIVITGLWEEIFTGSSSQNIYEVLYFTRPRSWVHLTVELEVPVSSDLWHLMRLSQHRSAILLHKTGFIVPTSLLHQISQGLASLGNIREDSRVRCRITGCGNSTLKVIHVIGPKAHHLLGDTLDRTEHSIMSTIYHMGCPRIDEREVARLACIHSPNRFFVSYDGRYLEEVVASHQHPSREFFHEIQLLHQLRQTPGFARLVGVTIDRTTQRVKSYLQQWPDTACQLLLDRASNPSFCHSWNQIENWSRQLLERIRAVHAVGSVVGTLWLLRPPVFVDQMDQVFLWHFHTHFVISSVSSPFYPPEFRHLARSDRKRTVAPKESRITPGCDVYQCGQLLWMLASGWASCDRSPLAIKEEFYKTPASCKEGFWFGPNPLPALPGAVPRWFQCVVDACLEPNVLARLSCEDLLKHFPPPEIDANTGTQLGMNTGHQNEASMRSCRLGSLYCDYCLRTITDYFYCCVLCHGGDFDICSECFEAGKHCHDLGHLLTKMDIEGGPPVTTSYYSSTIKDGKRKMYKL